MMLKRGVDIVVGTCGRIKDLLEKQMLRLKALQYVVLDEVDEMLNIGFADDVETILSQIGNGENSEKKNKKHQVLLFSATLPKWVEKIAMKYLAFL
ncbi:hypothetical protein MHBO_000638 [Bonamia ostreae]|uniref:Helicase ATP-binding domain-containing protein n=1 Tax=Bonamia ostreae TaxID=126728 RepID=A0ABV2AGH8_9EUKA